MNHRFNIPPATNLPNTTTVLPHVILGDKAFSLHENLMKPYPRGRSHDTTKRIYNYRLSRARRTTENAFGILAFYFRVFFQPISVNPEKCDNIILSACILHDMLRESKILCPGQMH